MTTTLLPRCLCGKKDRTACNWCRTPEIEEEKERFSNDCQKANPKVLVLRPITTRANAAMNQSEFLAMTCDLLKAREKSRAQGQGAIGFGFASV